MKKIFSDSANLYLLALALRLIPVLLSYDLSMGLDDMFQYDMLAQNLVKGNGFRWYGENEIALYQQYISVDFLLPENYESTGVLTSFRAPAYPVFLAIIYFFSSESRRWFMARIAQAFLGAFLAPLTTHLAKLVFPNMPPRTHKISGLILAIYPMFLVYPIGLATENLFIPLLLGSTISLLHATKREDVWRYVLTGGLFGLTVLTRSTTLAIVPALVLWLWFVKKQRKFALFLFTTIVLVIAPWSIRNSFLHKKFTLIETSIGYNLHMGYHPESMGTFTYGVSLELMPYIDDIAREEAGKTLALSYIRENPNRVPELIFRKLGHFFALETRPLVYFYSNNFLGYIPAPLLLGLFILFGMPFVLLSIFAVIGGSYANGNKASFLLILISVAYLIPHLLIIAEPRFHLALIPFFSVFASQIMAIRKKILSPSASKQIIATIIIGLLLLNWGLGLVRNTDKFTILFEPEGNQSYFSY